MLEQDHLGSSSKKSASIMDKSNPNSQQLAPNDAGPPIHCQNTTSGVSSIELKPIGSWSEHVEEEIASGQLKTLGAITSGNPAQSRDSTQRPADDTEDHPMSDSPSTCETGDERLEGNGRDAQKRPEDLATEQSESSSHQRDVDMDRGGDNQPSIHHDASKKREETICAECVAVGLRGRHPGPCNPEVRTMNAAKKEVREKTKQKKRGQASIADPQSPSPQAKKKKIACENCGKWSHSTAKCQSHGCARCGGKHMGLRNRQMPDSHWVGQYHETSMNDQVNHLVNALAGTNDEATRAVLMQHITGRVKAQQPVNAQQPVKSPDTSSGSLPPSALASAAASHLPFRTSGKTAPHTQRQSESEKRRDLRREARG
ncbi:hypothetical protein KC356_g430 [Hortaea werneckii]|nr:hypothetical protein KC356_g430 [Hortaea werneckii]